MLRHGGRMVEQSGVGGKLGYFLSVAVPVTVMGALAQQLYEIANGRDPKPMDPTTPEGRHLWGQGLLKGGALGPVGDFIGLTAQGRYMSARRICRRAADRRRRSRDLGRARNGHGKPRAKYQLAAARQGADPGNNVWYARLVLDRLLADQVQRQVDPSTTPAGARCSAAPRAGPAILLGAGRDRAAPRAQPHERNRRGHASMTLGTTRRSIDYVENGVTLVHAIPFQFRARPRSSARGSRSAPISDLRHFGAAADLTTNDHDAMAAAVALARPLTLNGAAYKLTGGHALQTDMGIFGPGRLDFDASVSAWLFSLGADGGAADVSNITIERVHFTSSSDISFTNLVRVSNVAGTIDRFHFLWNVIDYTPATGPGSGDRWVLAGTGAGARTNMQIIGNQLTGPMQLTASLVSSGSFDHGLIALNRIHNARANAISVLSAGTLGGPCSLTGLQIIGNDITADNYTSVGIALGLDNSSADRNCKIDALIARNVINIANSPVKTADVFVRLGNKCANIGGFDSDATLVIRDNEFHYGVDVDQATPVTASGFSKVSSWLFKGNDVFGGDVIFRDLADGAKFHDNTFAQGANIRPSANNGRIQSKGNLISLFVPLTADAEFNWYGDGDRCIGAASGTDVPFVLNANLGKVQAAHLTGGSIDSYTTGTPRAMVKAQGAGNPTITMKGVKTNTSWSLGRCERVTGTITDDGEAFIGSTITPASLAPGAADAVHTLTAYGARIGDAVTIGYSTDLKGQQVVGWVSANDTISYYVQNPSGNPVGTAAVGTGHVTARYSSQSA
jgi:hypothetical protein